MRTIVLNQNNIVQDGNNNTLVYKFPNSVTFSNSQIAVSQITMYYSWFNISAALGNNKFTFNWVQAAGTNTYITYTVTIPDGLYEISDLNAFIQFVFINGPVLSTSIISPTPTSRFYLVNGTGDYVYYFEWIVNPSAYGVQLNTYNVPTALPAGYTNPGSMVFPGQSYNPVVTTPSAFNAIVGFSSAFSSAQNQNDAGTNPGTATAYKIGSTYSYLSTITPQVQPNPNLLISISNIDNKYASPSSIIYSLAPQVAIGQLIAEKPPEYNFNRLLPGVYNELRVQFLTPLLEQVKIKDPTITIILVIKDL